MIYQHSDERQREVAAGLDDLVRAGRSVTKTIPTTLRNTTRRSSRANGSVAARAPLAGLDNKQPPGL